MKLITPLLIFFICLVVPTFSQNDGGLSPLNHLDFEENIPNFISASKGTISLSSNQRVNGENALRWDFVPGDVLTIHGKIGYLPQQVEKEIEILGDKYPTLNEPVLFKIPFYSEKQQDVILRIQFGRGEKVDCFIDIQLAFDGWKKFVIPYDRGHMRGTPQLGMDFMRIENISNHAGSVYLDDPVFAIRENPRTISASPLVPTMKNHPQRSGPNGANQVQSWQLEQPWFPLADSVSTNEKNAFSTIEDRLYDLEWGGRKSIKKLEQSKIEGLIEDYHYFIITRTGKFINGRHLDERSDRTKLNTLVKRIGIAYQQVDNSEQKKTLASMGVDLIEHAINVDNSISWYDGRGFADGCYLLKEELRKAGLFQKSIDFLHRAYEFPRFYNEDVINGRHGSISFSSDEIYTNSIGFILCVLMMDDSPEKVRDMKHFVSYYSNVAFNYSNGLTDTFKPDGSHFHHANAALTRYGAYTMPMVSEVIYILSKTTFRISTEAHERMKHNVLVRRFYRSLDYFPYAYAHNRIQPLVSHLFNDSRFLALAGTPDGQQDIDREMAAVYLRMMDGDKLPNDAQVFLQLGIEPEATPNGHHTLSYFAKSIHRKDDWMAVVGAHSRYVFQKENWSWHETRGNLKFGMFENWGSLEIIYPDKPELKQVDNGRTLDGWDWTRIPGVTSIEAPLERIKIQTIKKGDDTDEEHLRSDQPFVGGLDFADGNGVFAAKIRGHHKYHLESFYATKSWFFFGDIIVCLGSDIRNDLPEYTAHTCLFQNSFDVVDFNLSYNKVKPMKDNFFTLENLGEKRSWILDSRNVGYYIPEGQPFKVSYNLQKSRCFQDRFDTEAKIEKAWLEHGHAPDGVGYEYAVKVNTSASVMQAFAASKPYKVIQKDSKAHIVEHPESSSLGCVVFQQDYNLNAGALKGVSHSCILMLKENKGTLSLAISDPDLRFYEGFNTDINIQLNRKEEPSYSNHWHGHASIPSTIKVFLNGDWNINEIVKGEGKVVQRNNEITVLEFICKDGLTNEVVLIE